MALGNKLSKYILILYIDALMTLQQFSKRKSEIVALNDKEKKITGEKTLHKNLRMIMEHWEMLPVLDCILIEPSFLRCRWLKVDGKVPHKRADSRASASVSICFWAASSNLCDKMGIFNLVLRPQAQMAGLRKGWIATINTRCAWSCAAFVRNLCSEMGSKLWQPGLKMGIDMTASFHFLIQFFKKP